MGIFVLKFFLTNIVFSLIIGALMIRFNKSGSGTVPELLLYSLGMGPVVTVLMLYYQFLIIPGHSNGFYLASVCLVFGGLTVLAAPGFKTIGRHLKTGLKRFNFRQNPAPAAEILKTVLYWVLIFSLLAGFLVLYMGNTLQTPLEHHDALIYGNLGKYYYQHKQVKYERVMSPAGRGFVFQGSQKPSFSLLLTWEMMLNPETVRGKPEFDMYFRSISGYYGLLLLAITFLWLYRKNRYLALLGVLVQLAALRFLSMLVDYHLDSYRIFFLLLSWIFMAKALESPHRFSHIMFGLLSGFAAFTHLIGLAAASINLTAYLLFVNARMKTRLLGTGAQVLLVLLGGGIHYLLELFFGAAFGFVTYF
jgi:hypothetical protein